MKRTISIVALVLVAVLMVGCLAACGGSLGDGTYKLVEMKQGDQDMSDQIAIMEAAGMSIDLVVKGDKATLMGQEMTIKDGKFVVGDESVPFSVSGNKVTVEQEGTKMVFEKK